MKKTTLIFMILGIILFSFEGNAQVPVHSLTLGSSGTADGQFSYPCGIHVADNGEIYVADRNNERIQVFNGAGVFQRKWGSAGSGSGQFWSNGGCEDISFDASGNLWVSDRNNDRIQKFTDVGTFLMQLGTTNTPSSTNGEFDTPNGVAVDVSSGEIYVADRNNERIQVFNSAGVYQRKWGSLGNGNGQFSSNSGCEEIAIDMDGNIWATDRNNHRIQKFTNTGTYLLQLGITGSSGSANGQLSYPEGVAIHPSTGNIYVVDRNIHRIQVFNSAGAYLHQFGSNGSGNGQFSFPVDMAFDNDENMWVVDRNNHRLQKFTIPDIASTSWTGTDSWTESDNWSNGIPGSTTNATISSGTVTIDNAESCGNLTVNSDAALIISPSKSFTVTGNLSIAATKNSKAAATLTVQSDATGSGSLIVQGSSSGTVDFERYVTADRWHYVSSPVAGQAIDAAYMTNNSIYSPNGGTNYNFYRWDEITNYWIIYGDAGFSDTQFENAKGYIITRSADGNLDFSGTVATNNVSYPATFNAGQGEGFNLVGNPFTSSIGITGDAASTDNFLNANSANLDPSYNAIYVWNEQAGYTGNRDDYSCICNTGYAGYGSSSILPNDYIQPGQAFIVKVSSANNINFNENTQYHANDDFYKSEKEAWPGFELVVNGTSVENSTVIAFHEDMTTGLDPSYDVGKFKGDPDIALYTRLVDAKSETDFAVQALPSTDINNVIVPVGVDISEAGMYEFSIHHELMESHKIFLEDMQNNSFTNLKTESYSTLISESGTGRFYLHFENTAGIDAENIQEQKYNVYSYGSTLYLINKDNKNGYMNLRNIVGQIVHRFDFNSDVKQQFDVDVKPGFYVVDTYTQGKTYSWKVLIK